MENQDLHVVLASDNNYAQYVAVVLVSLFETNPDFRKVYVHLLCSDIDNDIIEMIRKHIPCSKGELIVYDADSSLKKVDIKVQNGFSISAYSRLFLGSILPDEIEKILYLDCDVLITGNLSNLWNTHLDDNWIAAVADSTIDSLSRIRIGLEKQYYYINSGVLLINLKEWRKNKLEQVFVDTIKEYDGDIYHKDQGVLNKVCHNHLLLLPPNYNVQTNFYSHPYCLMEEAGVPFYSLEEYKNATSNPLIIHFTLGYYNRPWCQKAEHPMADQWRITRAKTAWADCLLLPDNRLPQVKLLGWALQHLPFFLFHLLNKGVYCIYQLRH